MEARGVRGVLRPSCNTPLAAPVCAPPPPPPQQWQCKVGEGQALPVPLPLQSAPLPGMAPPPPPQPPTWFWGWAHAGTLSLSPHPRAGHSKGAVLMGCPAPRHTRRPRLPGGRGGGGWWQRLLRAAVVHYHSHAAAAGFHLIGKVIGAIYLRAFMGSWQPNWAGGLAVPTWNPPFGDMMASILGSCTPGSLPGRWRVLECGGHSGTAWVGTAVARSHPWRTAVPGLPPACLTPGSCPSWQPSWQPCQ